MDPTFGVFLEMIAHWAHIGPSFTRCSWLNVPAARVCHRRADVYHAS